MEETKCKNCGAPIKQTTGKRAKEFCDVTCRSGFWQKKKRGSLPSSPIEKTFPLSDAEVKPVGARKAKFKETKTANPADKKVAAGGLVKLLEPTFQPPIIYDKFGKPIDAPLIDKPVVDELRSYCSEEGGTNLLISFSFPKDFAGILRLAKEWKGDVEAFKNKVNGLNLTANQKSMILSKLK